MNKNLNKKISIEQIIAYIEGNLSNTDKTNIETLIKSDDHIFKLYSDCYSSYQELLTANLEVTPDSLLKKSNPKSSTKVNASLINKIRSWLNSIFIIPTSDSTYNFRLVPVMASFVLVIIITALLTNRDETDSNSRPDMQLIQDRFSSYSKPAVATSPPGIDVNIVSDSIYVNQPFRFSRDVVIEDNNGIVRQKFNITTLDTSFIIDPTLAGKPLILKVITLDSIVYSENFIVY